MKLNILIAASGFTVVGIVSVVCWACIPTMTMCLTFDDDQNAHATIAGPVLERYGWRGAFNIVTGRLEHPRAEGKMTWAQAQELLAHGHEIYPHSLFPDPDSHTFSHYNLRVLAEAGNLEEVERQIMGGKAMIEQRLGISPQYFCLPFNQANNAVREVIIKSGMFPMNSDRRNFPTHPGRVVFGDGGIEDYVMHEYRDGTIHVDIMMHGIVREEGAGNHLRMQLILQGFVMN